MQKGKKKARLPVPTEKPPSVPAKKNVDIVQIAKDWEPIWDAEFQLAFEALLPKQRKFVVEYVKAGYKKREAFRNAYGTSYSESIVHALLSKEGVQLILGRFTDWARDDLFRAHKVLEEAMEAKKGIWYEGVRMGEEDDHAVRIKAVEVLNKIATGDKDKGPQAPGTIPTNFITNFNIYAEQMGFSPTIIPVEKSKKNSVKIEQPESTKDFARSFQDFSEEENDDS